MKHRSYFKVAAVFSLALAVSALLFTTLVDVNPVHANGGYGVPLAGGGGGHPVRRLEVDLSGDETKHVINRQGELQETVERISDDKMLILTLPEGTIALDEENEPLKRLEITIEEYPPPPPNEARFIGLVYNFIGQTYDFEPSRVTFIPSMAITFYYEHSMLPRCILEEDLILAYYNEEIGVWVNLTSYVDTVTNSVTAEINHLCNFAILGYPSPATFVASDLSITPKEVNTGEEVTISFTITNTGCVVGSYEIPIKINGVMEASQMVTLAGGASKKITLTTVKDIGGVYTVVAHCLSDTFTVKEIPKPAAFTVSALSISPIEVDIEENVTISAQITNTGDLTGSYKVTFRIDGALMETRDVTVAGGTSQILTFTTTENTAGTYIVTVNGKSDTFTVKPPPKVINWWLIAATIAGVILAIIGTRKLALHRKASSKYHRRW